MPELTIVSEGRLTTTEPRRYATSQGAEGADPLPAPSSSGGGGTEFSVSWTGPNGPSDYITIVPAGSAEGAYLDYAYTAAGNPVTLGAPAEPGDYEIWYASDHVSGTFASITIVVEYV